MVNHATTSTTKQDRQVRQKIKQTAILTLDLDKLSGWRHSVMRSITSYSRMHRQARCFFAGLRRYVPELKNAFVPVGWYSHIPTPSLLAWQKVLTDQHDTIPKTRYGVCWSSISTFPNLVLVERGPQSRHFGIGRRGFQVRNSDLDAPLEMETIDSQLLNYLEFRKMSRISFDERSSLDSMDRHRSKPQPGEVVPTKCQ